MTKIDSLRTDIRKAEKLRREIELRAEEATTGQLISECLLGFIDFPKKQRKFLQISALESKKWSNQQSKSTFL